MDKGKSKSNKTQNNQKSVVGDNKAESKEGDKTEQKPSAEGDKNEETKLKPSKDEHKSKLTNVDKLKQLIYTCDMTSKYRCGGPDKQIGDIKVFEEVLRELLKNSHKDILKIVETASNDEHIPNRSQLFYVLALVLRLDEATEVIKPEICSMVLKIAKNDSEIMQFVKYTVLSRKLNETSKSRFGTSVRKAVGNYYRNKNAEELVQSYVAFRGRHGWSHKDLIKYCHIKSESVAMTLVTDYILFKKLKSEENIDPDVKPLIDRMMNADILRSTSDIKVAIPIISELKATIEQVEPKLRRSAEIWNAVLPNMALSDILQALPFLYKRGFLKKDAPTHAKVIEMLTNSQNVSSSGIHPIEVFIRMKTFEKGGRPIDPQLLLHLKTEKQLSEEEITKLQAPNEVKAPLVMSSLQKCMNIACSSNVHSTGKRYLITIDTTDKMDLPCLCSKNISGIEAAAAFTWFLLRTEKDVTVAVFNEKEVDVVQLEKRGHLYEHVQKLRENKSKFLIPATPIEWATSQKKHYDVFINFIHHKEYYVSIPKEHRDKQISCVEALQKYRKKVNLQNAKLVTFCTSSPRLIISNGTPNILDIAGLDVATPRVLEAFCCGHFS